MGKTSLVDALLDVDIGKARENPQLAIKEVLREQEIQPARLPESGNNNNDDDNNIASNSNNNSDDNSNNTTDSNSNIAVIKKSTTAITQYKFRVPAQDDDVVYINIIDTPGVCGVRVFPQMWCIDNMYELC